MIHRNNDFATQALKSIENEEFNQPSRKRVMMIYPSTGNSSADIQRCAPLKRSRSRPTLSATFDMGEFLKASEQVEETIAFPKIEWPSFNDDESNSSDGDDSYTTASSLARPSEAHEEIDDEDDEDFNQNRRKRQCRGLTRCSRSCNLSSLWELGNSSERHGSNGSLS